MLVFTYFFQWAFHFTIKSAIPGFVCEIPANHSTRRDLMSLFSNSDRLHSFGQCTEHTSVAVAISQVLTHLCLAPDIGHQ